MVRTIVKLGIVAGAVYAAKRLYEWWAAAPSAPPAELTPPGPTRAAGFDTPTGTDPAAKYDRPGYEDKSFGQAVGQDQALVDRLVEEEHGDLDSAADRFERESAGAPARARQHARP